LEKELMAINIFNLPPLLVVEKKLIFRLLVAIIFFQNITSITYAGMQCSEPVTYLLEEKPAPCSGFLFSPEKELEVRTKIANYNNMGLMVDRTQELNDILYKRVSNLQEQNLLLSKEVQDRSNTNIYLLLGSFSLGVIATAILAKSLK
jgi:hypothetical protein